MTKIKPVRLICALSACLFCVFQSSYIFASDDGDTSSSSSNNCSYPENYASGLETHLKDLQENAMLVGTEICKRYLSDNIDNDNDVADHLRFDLLREFTKNAKNALDKMFPESDFPGLGKLSEEWKNQVENTYMDYRKLDLIQEQRIQSDTPPVRTKAYEFWLRSDDSNKIRVNASDSLKSHCEKIILESEIQNLKQNCSSVFKLWANAVSPFQFLITNNVLTNNSRKIITLQNEWNLFIDNARYQTPLDVWATTAWYRDDFSKNTLSGPPDKQLFLLHPVLVYEHISDAQKGSKQDVSIAIEWVGMNWWKKGLGYSLTSVYNDRKTEPYHGYGFTLHIKNKYSFGFIKRHHGNDSIFVNIDLLEWLGDKNEKYKKYKDQF